MLKGAGSTGSGVLSGIVGVVLLLVAALGVVVQLKDALNTIWETKEPESAGVWWYLRTYLISFAGILGLGFLLAVSLVISTVLSAFSSWLGGGESLFWQALNFLVSVGVLAVLFAMLFKWFPDADVRWEAALKGGVATSLLFNIGKLAIGWYIGSQGLESTYGAAASIVVLLIWVYYSAQIVLFGAEVTHVLGSAEQSPLPQRKAGVILSCLLQPHVISSSCLGSETAYLVHGLLPLRWLNGSRILEGECTDFERRRYKKYCVHHFIPHEPGESSTNAHRNGTPNLLSGTEAMASGNAATIGTLARNGPEKRAMTIPHAPHRLKNTRALSKSLG